MWSLGPTQLISLFLAVALVAAMCGYTASAVARRNKRRARGFFLLGFCCGWMAGPILRGKRRGTGRYAIDALTLAASHVRPGAALARIVRRR
ncbi:MAG: hypothetical protein QOH27_57 [Mycobacterium sp.]|nr:hypothetical protein [Mycobacterium sp.]